MLHQGGRAPSDIRHKLRCRAFVQRFQWKIDEICNATAHRLQKTGRIEEQLQRTQHLRGIQNCLSHDVCSEASQQHLGSKQRVVNSNGGQSEW